MPVISPLGTLCTYWAGYLFAAPFDERLQVIGRPVRSGNCEVSAIASNQGYSRELSGMIAGVFRPWHEELKRLVPMK